MLSEPVSRWVGGSIPRMFPGDPGDVRSVNADIGKFPDVEPGKLTNRCPIVLPSLEEAEKRREHLQFSLRLSPELRGLI